ncbi:MAG: N-acyl homoserine lactonase family protein [Bacillota bacterium]|nr:N-acyl homoserine lactonase family protein [Bacillota bacterium]
MIFERELAVVPLLCGRLIMERSVFSGRSHDQVLELPVFAFLIVHPQSYILFDTGLPSELWLSQTSLKLTEGLTAITGESTGLLGELKRKGYDPSKISVVVNSHGHLDHASGNCLLPQARIYRKADENSNAAVTAEFDESLRKTVFVKGDYDLFGDGLVRMLATPGHSSDHQSLLVQGENRSALFTGDACFRPANLESLILPLIVENREQALSSLKRLKEISLTENVIVFTTHDPLATDEKIYL